jgi:hypothetical protein
MLSRRRRDAHERASGQTEGVDPVAGRTAGRRVVPRGLLVAVLGLTAADIVLPLLVVSLRPASTRCLPALIIASCVMFVLSEHRTVGPAKPNARNRPSVLLILASATARTGCSPWLIARAFRLPLAFAELLVADTRCGQAKARPGDKAGPVA